MAKGDNVVLTCPHCGQQASYQIRHENVNQTDNCSHCRKMFTVDITNGQIKQVRK